MAGFQGNWQPEDAIFFRNLAGIPGTALVISGALCVIFPSRCWWSNLEVSLRVFELQTVGKGLLLRSLLLPAGVFLLLSVAGLSSSSEAEDALFVRTQAEIERLWSGVLGCAESDEPFTIRNRFNDSGGLELEGVSDGAIPTGTLCNYSECGKRTLRNASLHMLVNAFEDALRGGGLAFSAERV